MLIETYLKSRNTWFTENKDTKKLPMCVYKGSTHLLQVKKKKTKMTLRSHFTYQIPNIKSFMIYSISLSVKIS